MVIIMDNILPENAMLHFTGGVIENISSDRNNIFVTVSYTECMNCARRDQRIVLVIGNNTVILNESGNRISAGDLQEGMVINATFSSVMTRSIPPQARAYLIRVVQRPESENITTGRIINIDRQNRSFTTISDSDMSSAIRFIVPENASITNIFGRPMEFSDLVVGLRVRVRHAAFMTASIPPQTTAFEIRVIR